MVSQAELKKLKQENRKLRKYLKLLSDVVSKQLYIIDKTLGQDKTIPRHASKELAKIANRLDFANDEVRHFVFDLDITAEGKEKYAQKLIANHDQTITERR